jgi:hypothetical protein
MMSNVQPHQLANAELAASKQLLLHACHPVCSAAQQWNAIGKLSAS